MSAIHAHEGSYRNHLDRLDVAAVAAAVGTRTAAILPVHLDGQLCDMPALSRRAVRQGIALLEDAGQAHGARCGGQPAGALHVGAAFSFYPSKNFGPLGDIGAIYANDMHVGAAARELRNLGPRRQAEHVVLGVNKRLDRLQAAALNVKLGPLEQANAARPGHAARYRRILTARVKLLEARRRTPSVYHLFPVRIPKRDVVAERMRRAGIEVAVHYPRALHQQPALRDVVSTPKPLPHAEAWEAEEVLLPMSPAVESSEVKRAAEACGSAVEDLRGPDLPTALAAKAHA